MNYKKKTKYEVQYYKAVLLSEKVWEWLADNPGKEKEDSPYWNKIRFMQCNCPICELHLRLAYCSTCFLAEYCSKTYHNWLLYVASDQIYKAQESATIIWERIFTKRLELM